MLMHDGYLEEKHLCMFELQLNKLRFFHATSFLLGGIAVTPSTPVLICLANIFLKLDEVSL